MIQVKSDTSILQLVPCFARAGYINYALPLRSGLKSLATPSSNLLLAGDLNFHVDIPCDREAAKFLDLLSSANLHQHVVGPTHTHGHTLDLIITPNDVSLIGDITIQHGLPSDHFATTCLFNLARPPSTKRCVKVCCFCDIDMSQLKQDILTTPLIDQPQNDVNRLTQQYDTILRELSKCVRRSSDLIRHGTRMNSERKNKNVVAVKERGLY